MEGQKAWHRVPPGVAQGPLADFAQARNATLAATRHLGWRLWKKWSGYHRRSLVETTMGRLKLLGERLAARQPERQVPSSKVGDLTRVVRATRQPPKASSLPQAYDFQASMERFRGVSAIAF